MDPKQLSEAELVVMNGGELAIALAYAPGDTPTVVGASTGAGATELLWGAQELGLPIFDCPGVETATIKGLEIGQEIPEALYRPVAQCLAAVQRSKPGPQQVRLVKLTGTPARQLSKRLKRRLDQVLDDLEVSRIQIRLGAGWDREALAGLLELHRHRLQAEMGLPLAPFEALVGDDMQDFDYQILLREVPYVRGYAKEPGPVLRDLYVTLARHGWRLLGYRETEALVEGVRRRHARLYKDLFPDRLTLGALRRILRNLLKEGIPIRDLPAIMEVLLEHLPQVQDPDQLTEFVRADFAAWLTGRCSDSHGRLCAMLLDPVAEQAILKGLRETASALWLDLDLDANLRLLGSVARGLERAQRESRPAVVLCSPRPRRFLRRLLEPSFPDLPVLSYAEVAPMTEVQTICTLTL